MGITRIVDGTVTVVHAEGTLDSGKDFVVEYLGAPFDWKFDMDNESEIYCTELLYLVFKQLMPEIELKTIYIKELGKEIMPLEAISNSEYFSEIYYKDNW